MQLKSIAPLLRALTLAMTCALSLPAAAEDDDAQRLASYRLSMPTLKKMEAALDHLVVAVQKNPQLVDGEEPEGESIADIANFYEQRAPLRDAIKRGGLSTDEFSLALMSWMQAGMAYGFAQSLPEAQRAKALADTGVPPANIEFVKANKAYLDAVGAKMKALEAKTEGASEDGEDKDS